jgi:cobalt-zinc-cadmium efflux system outer membrane protein
MNALVLISALLFGQPSDTLTLTFERARVILENQSPSLFSAKAELSARHADITQAKLLPNPQISYNASFINPFVFPIDYSSTQAILRIDQTFQIGKKRSYKINEANHSYEEATSRYRYFANELLFTLREAFINAAYSDLRLQIAKDNSQLFSKVIEISDERLKHGDISEAEYRELSLERIEYLNSELDAENQYRNSIAELESLLGMSSERPIKIDYQLESDSSDYDMGATFPSEDSLVSFALQNRLDLISMQEELEAQSYRRKYARASIVPDIDVGVELDKQGPEFRNTFGGGLAFEIPIFNRNQDEIERADADYYSTYWSYIDLENRIKNEVRTAYRNYFQSIKLFRKYLPDFLGNAKLVRDMATKNYLLGNIGLVEFLQAEKIYVSSINNYYDAIYRLQMNKIKLERTIGKELSEEVK